MVVIAACHQDMQPPSFVRQQIDLACINCIYLTNVVRTISSCFFHAGILPPPSSSQSITHIPTPIFSPNHGLIASSMKLPLLQHAAQQTTHPIPYIALSTSLFTLYQSSRLVAYSYTSSTLKMPPNRLGSAITVAICRAWLGSMRYICASSRSALKYGSSDLILMDWM